MQAFQHAFGHSDLLAPKPFRDALRRAFPRSELDCWLSPGDVRTEIENGVHVKQEGCWVIWMRVTEHVTLRPSAHLKVSAPRHMWCPVFKLDGTFGLPVTPGSWAITALLESDMTRECNRDRAAYINHLHYEDQMKQFEERKRMHAELTKDRVFRALGKKHDEKYGKESMSGDDRKAWVKEWDRIERKDLAEAEKRARDVQFYKRG